MEIKRDIYLNRLIVRKHNGFIKVITGIRRSGKSYLLNTLFYNHLVAEHIGEDHISDMLPPLNSKSLKWGLPVQWLS